MSDERKQVKNPVLSLAGLRVLSEVLSRTELQSTMGKSYGTDRDLYEACGYPQTLTFQSFLARFDRQDISNVIVEAYPNDTWDGIPQVYETESADLTPFESDWNALVNKLHLFHYFRRVDILAGIGQYATLLIGFDDGKGFEQPVDDSRPNKVLYLQPYMESSVQIESFEEDKNNSRYGLPKMYKVEQVTKSGSVTTQMQYLTVHYSRMLHVADNCRESDVYGTSRLRAVYNRLQDMETLSAGATEMFWRGGFPGYGFTLPADANLTDTQITTLDDEIKDYVHGLKRYMRLQGIEINPLTPQVADPSGHFDMLIQLLSAATGIPKRILTGSERGELSSSQDEERWRRKIQRRRTEFAEPRILRPFGQMMIKYGVVSPPAIGDFDNVFVTWPDITSMTEKDKSQVGFTKSRAISNYAQIKESARVLPPRMFQTMVLGLSEDEADEAKKQSDQLEKEGYFDVEPDAEGVSKPSGGAGGSGSNPSSKGQVRSGRTKR